MDFNIDIRLDPSIMELCNDASMNYEIEGILNKYIGCPLTEVTRQRIKNEIFHWFNLRNIDETKYEVVWR